MERRIDLIRFMETHVYVVWDFMCLLHNLKRLSYQGSSGYLWQPPNMMSYGSMRLLNEIILEEETDLMPDGSYSSHLDLYLRAMKEVGADTQPFESFLRSKNFSSIPEPARSFVHTTFSFIETNKIHVLASAFTYGRELIIPDLFINLLDNLKLEAPLFRYYLNRHITLDREEHAPKALNLLEELVDNNPVKRKEVEETRIVAIRARDKLWKELVASTSR